MRGAHTAIKGKVWKFGDNVDTDQIIPAEYLVTGDSSELGIHAFEKFRSEFAKKVGKGDIIVAGGNFGCGSSREHAPRALLGSGIACVIARSFARIFFRNSINIGLPLAECEINAEDGDELHIDFGKGEIKNLNNGASWRFKPLPPFLLDLIATGGLKEYTKKRLKQTAGRSGI